MATLLFPVTFNVAFIFGHFLWIWRGENFVYRARITVILVSDLFDCTFRAHSQSQTHIQWLYVSLWLTMCSKWRIVTASGFVRRLENVKCRCLHSCLVILPFPIFDIQKYHISEVKVLALWAYNAIVAKRVTWTLRSNRPRKTGSKYNDTLSCVAKPKGSVTMSQKAVSFGCLLCDFRQNRTGRIFTPSPVAS